MNSNNSSKNKDLSLLLKNSQRSAMHGDFYFANFVSNNLEIRKSPVFVIGVKDNEDIIICSCTKHPPRSEYDVAVQLKLPTSVRTNKIYTIRRDQLAFKISQSASTNEYKQIIEKIKESLEIH